MVAQPDAVHVQPFGEAPSRANCLELLVQWEASQQQLLWPSGWALPVDLRFRLRPSWGSGWRSGFDLRPCWTLISVDLKWPGSSTHQALSVQGILMSSITVKSRRFVFVCFVWFIPDPSLFLNWHHWHHWHVWHDWSLNLLVLSTKILFTHPPPNPKSSLKKPLHPLSDATADLDVQDIGSCGVETLQKQLNQKNGSKRCGILEAGSIPMWIIAILPCFNHFFLLIFRLWAQVAFLVLCESYKLCLCYVSYIIKILLYNICYYILNIIHYIINNYHLIII